LTFISPNFVTRSGAFRLEEAGGPEKAARLAPAGVFVGFPAETEGFERP
jgi:hypothetical protein